MDRTESYGYVTSLMLNAPAVDKEVGWNPEAILRLWTDDRLKIEDRIEKN